MDSTVKRQRAIKKQRGVLRRVIEYKIWLYCIHWHSYKTNSINSLEIERKKSREREREREVGWEKRGVERERERESDQIRERRRE